MRWQPIVKPIQLLVATVLFTSFDDVAAGLVLPPLVADPQHQAGSAPQRPCRYTGDFKQERKFEELANPLVSSGSFMFSCNKGLLWEVREPIPDTRIYSTEKLNFRVRNNARVTQLKSIVESRTAKLLLNFLGGNMAALSKDFDLVSDSNTPGTLVLLPKQKAVQKRLTQLTVQQESDTIRITLQAPAVGDVVITIDNIAGFEQGEHAACRQFSQQPRPNCSVLISPADFVATQPDQNR